ncbi:MAG TPA: hypothetical protein VI320_25185, partial [Terracidiphilus sp.]
RRATGDAGVTNTRFHTIVKSGLSGTWLAWIFALDGIDEQLPGHAWKADNTLRIASRIPSGHPIGERRHLDARSGVDAVARLTPRKRVQIEVC